MKKSKDSSVDAGAKKPTKKSRKVNNLYLVLIVVVALVLGAGAFGYKTLDDSKRETAKLKEEKAQLENPQESARLETERVKASVAKLIDVPTDEDPTIASVTDVSKLQNQAFYSKAQNGDKVLLYAKAKKAILYRPSANKIIEVATLNLGEADKAAPAATETSQ